MNATIAQVVERYIGNVEVTGPTPVSSLQENRLSHFATAYFYVYSLLNSRFLEAVQWHFLLGLAFHVRR